MVRKYLERIENIDRLIRIRGTGPPRELANRLGISERSLYESLSLMKEMGAPIEYCTTRRSYFYETEGFFSFGFKQKLS